MGAVELNESPTADEKALLEGYRTIVEEKLGLVDADDPGLGRKRFETFTAVAFTKQVVNGMIYQVKYQVAASQFVHAQIFVSLPHVGTPPEV